MMVEGRLLERQPHPRRLAPKSNKAPTTSSSTSFKGKSKGGGSSSKSSKSSSSSSTASPTSTTTTTAGTSCPTEEEEDTDVVTLELIFESECDDEATTYTIDDGVNAPYVYTAFSGTLEDSLTVDGSGCTTITASGDAMSEFCGNAELVLIWDEKVYALMEFDSFPMQLGSGCTGDFRTRRRG
eukprot:Nitzschia sp. Nitz4//scaffold454_size8830//5534//6082//NITZ4_009113-RA/size8830-processed-gene-0.6-mRNA-1//1//CDS//3329552285//2031//frame0